MRTRLWPFLALLSLGCQERTELDRRVDTAESPDAATWGSSDGGQKPATPPVATDASGMEPAQDAGKDAGPVEPACTHDLGCPSGICEAKQCVPSECANAADCAANERCRAGRCEALPCGGHTFTYDPKGRMLTSVAVAGTFNGWNKDSAAAQLRFEAQTQTFRGYLEVGAGSHEYKLVLNGGEWLLDPANTQTTGGSAPNSKLVIDCPFICDARTDEFDWRDAVLYFAMVDRFHNGDGQGSAPAAGGDSQNPRNGYGGGDIAGLTAKLPYLTELGVSALWITSPAQNLQGGYHGYWPAPQNIDYSDPKIPSRGPQ